MNNSKLNSVLFSAFLAASVAGCGISVEADVPDVEVTQHDLAFDGVPLSSLIGDVSLSRNFSQKHKKLDLPAGLDSQVKALSVSLIAKNGIKDFGFIHNLRMTMSDDVHQPVQLIDYQQTPGAPPSGILTMQSANPVNTLEQWKTESATFTVEVAGRLPEQAWTIDLSIHFGGSFKYSP
jgi:hypothetical protein